MNYKILIAALSVLMISGCASNTTTSIEPEAQPVAASPAAGEEDVVASNVERAADDGDRVVCRVITPTGSHRKKTVCRTVKEIRQDRDSAQDALRTKQGAAVSGGGD